MMPSDNGPQIIFYRELMSEEVFSSNGMMRFLRTDQVQRRDSCKPAPLQFFQEKRIQVRRVVIACFRLKGRRGFPQVMDRPEKCCQIGRRFFIWNTHGFHAEFSLSVTDPLIPEPSRDMHRIIQMNRERQPVEPAFLFFFFRPQCCRLIMKCCHTAPAIFLPVSAQSSAIDRSYFF